MKKEWCLLIYKVTNSIWTVKEWDNTIFIKLEIGIGLSGFGTFFVTLGVLFLFDKGLLVIGNVSLTENKKKL